MATVKLLESDRTTLAETLIARWDLASGPCTLEFYDGAQPAGPSVAVSTQVKLGTLTCSDPIAVAATGAITFNAIVPDSAADATGTATWVRLRDGAGVARADFDVSLMAGAGAIKMNNTSIVLGGPILAPQFIITMPGG